MSRLDGWRAVLELTERNLTSLINARHHDAVLMTDWREVVREALSSQPKQGKPGDPPPHKL